MIVSGNYRPIEDPAELEELEGKYANSWKDPNIPKTQYEMAVRIELEKYRQGAKSVPFDAIVRCLLSLPEELDRPETTLLEIGASSGYYSEVLKIAGFKYKYIASDYSQAFKDFAATLYPNLEFHVADAAKMPFPDKSFDIVLSGCCLLHMKNYEEAISESVRLARKYILFHRTPIRLKSPTTHYLKEAYGVPCIEIHFSEHEFFQIMTHFRLKCRHIETLFFNMSEDFGHRSYVFEVNS